jgi:hypothetical protein
MSKLNDRATLRQINDDIVAALAAVGVKHSIKLTTGNTKYDGDGMNATFQVNASAITATGTVVTPDGKNWDKYRHLYGMGHIALGTEFVARGTKYKITGLNPGAPKFPVKAVRVWDGTTFKFPSEAVLKALPAPAKAVA